MEWGWLIAAIALFFTILVQTVSVVWFFSRLSSRVEFLEKVTTKNEDTNNRLIKLETYLEIVQRQQDDQILKLDKIISEQASAKLERQRLLDKEGKE